MLRLDHLRGARRPVAATRIAAAADDDRPASARRSSSSGRPRLGHLAGSRPCAVATELRVEPGDACGVADVGRARPRRRRRSRQRRRRRRPAPARSAGSRRLCGPTRSGVLAHERAAAEPERIARPASGSWCGPRRYRPRPRPRAGSRASARRRREVVPPMSTTMASRRPERNAAPRIELVGPEAKVSTGYCSAKSAPISVPSFWVR